MSRITMKHLEGLVERLNSMTNSPPQTYVKNSEGRYKAQIDNFHLDGAYGGWALYRICSDGGACNDISGCGHVPKKELYDRISSLIQGWDLYQSEGVDPE